MKISDKGIELIKSFEGLSLKAYKCLATEKYYTIGYGHYGSDVKANQTITKEKALELLKSDVAKFESKVNKYQNVYNFNQNQYDALMSFCYNVGNIDQLTANGTRTIDKISSCILLYNKSGGKVVSGLTTRRKKEKALFDTAVENSDKYFAKYTGTSISIVDALTSLGIDSSLSYRSKIASANGIAAYRGYSAQNNTLLNLLKRGLLIKP
jgi:GH24 family phage-related lysozyme (muramidase)